jgi:hypothetical protein
MFALVYVQENTGQATCPANGQCRADAPNFCVWQPRQSDSAQFSLDLFFAYEKMRFNLLRVFSAVRVCGWAAA